MSRMAALLRGINVGGHKRVPMARLRTLLEGIGFSNVETHLQSGNVVFTTRLNEANARRTLTSAIAGEFGFEVDVFVRTAKELQAVVAANPLASVADDGSKYLVPFLEDPPDAALLAKVAGRSFAPERFEVKGREVYVWCAGGVRDSALLKALGKVSSAGTARNWNTVVRVAELAGSA